MSKKIIDNFIKKNFLKIKRNNNKKKILLIDRGIAESAIMNSLFAYALNKNFLFDIDLLTSFSKKNTIFKIYKSFGIEKKISINIKHNISKIELILLVGIEFFLSFLKICVLGRSWFINNYSLKNIYFGDLIYDEYIRNDHNFLNRNLINLNFLKILLISIYKINFLNNLISKKKYNYIMSPTHTYASNAALCMRVALKKKIKVLNVLSSRLRIYKKLAEAEKIEYVLDLKFLKDKVIFNKDWLKRFDLMIKNRYRGKIKYVTAKDAYHNKKKIEKNDFLKIFNFKKDSFKRIVFYAPHCFSDANHKAGKFIFDDYYDQFQTTLKFAEKDKNSLWIIKIHPTSYKYKEENLINKLIKNKKSINIIICPNKFSTFSLIKFSDLIITGRGTIGLEAACFGKKPLLAGETFYSKFGITHNPIDTNDYINKISNYKLLSKLSKKQILSAKKLFYLVVFKNSYTKRDKILVSNYLRADAKSNKIYQQFLNEDDFIKEITKKIDKKIDLSKDQIFQNFKKDFIEQEAI